MKITLQSTAKIVQLNGVPARIWQGESSKGIACHAYITRIAVREDHDSEEFDRDLQECVPVSPDVARLAVAALLDGVADTVRASSWETLIHALEESVKLQSHYAQLLNAHDGGERMQFKSAAYWVARLAQLRKRGGD